jgi:hypothetical protein
MTHRFAICLAIASSTFIAPRPAAAAVTHTFDTVDAVEITTISTNRVIVTGILVGQTTPTTVSFTFSAGATNLNQANECQRLGVIAMAKAGKYRFAIGATDTGGNNGGCKLILRTP